MQSDSELAAAWAKGDEDAYSGLVDRYGGLIHSVLERRLGASDADDATQAVFLVLCQKARTAATVPSVAAWLLTIAHNVERNVVRERRRRKVRDERIQHMARSANETPDPELAADLEAALGKLGQAERAAILLHHVHGLTQAEIAQRESCPVGTIKARVSRGLERLRGYLSKKRTALSLLALIAALENLRANDLDPALRMQLVRLPSADLAVTNPTKYVQILRWSKGSGTFMLVLNGSLALVAAGSILTWTLSGPDSKTVTGLPEISGQTDTTQSLDSIRQSQEKSPISATKAETFPDPGPVITEDAIFMVARLNDIPRTLKRLKEGPFAAAVPLIQSYQNGMVDSLQTACGTVWRQTGSEKSQNTALRGSLGSLVVATAERDEDRLPLITMIEEEIAKVSQNVIPSDLKTPAVEKHLQNDLLQELRQARSDLLDKKLTYRSDGCQNGRRFTFTHKESEENIQKWFEKWNMSNLPKRDVSDGVIWQLGPMVNRLRITPGCIDLWGAYGTGSPDPAIVCAQTPDFDAELLVTVQKQGKRQTLASVRTRLDENGLSLEAQQSNTGTMNLPRFLEVDLSLMNQIPSSAMAAMLLRLDGKSLQQCQDLFLTPITAGTQMRVFDVGSKGKYALHSSFEYSLFDPQLDSPVISFLKPILGQCNGHLVVWLESQGVLPIINGRMDMPKEVARQMFQNLIAQKMVTSEGDLSVRQNFGIASLQVSWKDGQLLFTTNPQGIAVLANSDKGFVQHADIKAGIAALPASGKNLVILARPKAIIEQLSMLLAFSPDAAKHLQDPMKKYIQHLEKNPGRSWLTLGIGPDGLTTKAEGLIANAVALTAMANLLGGYEKMMEAIKRNS